MRIIAGKFKGTKLNSFELDNIRPTIDRVREAIFSKLQFKIPNAVVLDLFGGTGAVSIEFLSRYAQKVVTVDNNTNSVNLIKENFNKVKLTPNLMVADYMDALNKLQKQKIKFDIVFLDPPFNSNFAELALPILSSFLLNDDGMIVYEHLENKEFNIPSDLIIVDEKKYGTIKVSYLEKKHG